MLSKAIQWGKRLVWCGVMVISINSFCDYTTFKEKAKQVGADVGKGAGYVKTGAKTATDISKAIGKAAGSVESLFGNKATTSDSTPETTTTDSQPQSEELSKLQMLLEYKLE